MAIAGDSQSPHMQIAGSLFLRHCHEYESRNYLTLRHFRELVSQTDGSKEERVTVYR
jgi:hypothetical protein